MIRTENLTVSYQDQPVVRDVSLDIPGGEIMAVVGPSGCGKTSFLAALNRMTDLIPHAEVKGRVWIDCCDVREAKKSPVELRRCVGMIFQKPNPFPISIRENIQLALREHGMRDRDQLEQHTRSVLEDVGLWDEVKARLSENALKLSGGQQQRLCLARALALKPQVLLMDEPCSALDPMAAGRVESLIRELKGRYTVVIVTHNLAQARRISDRLAVFWISDGIGTVVEHGPTDRVFAQPSHPVAAAYLSGHRG